MEIQILGLLLSLFESRTLGVVGWRVSTLYFNKSLGDSDAVQIREQLPWGKMVHDPSLMNEGKSPQTA